MKKLVLIIIAVLLAGTAAWFLLHGSKDAARDILPADATTVAVLEPVELMRGLGLKPDKASKLVLNLKDFAEGIDLTKPVYAFASESGLTGIALSVKDEEALLKAFSGISYASEEQQGYQWIANRSSIGCMDKDKLLLIAPAAETQQDALRAGMMRLMRQSRQDVPALDQANKQKGFLRVSAAVDGAGTVGAGLSIGERDITLSTEATELAPAVKGAAEVLSPSGGLLPTIGKEPPFAWLYMNVNGEKLLPVLRSNPQIRDVLTGLNVGVFDADLFLKAISGDVMVAVPSLNLLHPEVYGAVCVTSTDFLANADEWTGVTRIGEKDYLFSGDDVQLFFRDCGGSLFFATTRELFDSYLREGNGPGLQANAAGRYLSGSVDVGGILRGNPSVAILLAAMPSLAEAVGAIGEFKVSASGPQSLELSLTTNKPVREIITSIFPQ